MKSIIGRTGIVPGLRIGRTQDNTGAEEDEQFLVDRKGFAPSGFLKAMGKEHTPAASSVYHRLEDNHITLTPGAWMVFGVIRYKAHLGQSVINRAGWVWTTRNGDDTDAVPPQIPLQAGFPSRGRLFDNPGGKSEYKEELAPVRIRVTEETKLYLVPIGEYSKPEDIRLATYIFAEQREKI